MATARIATVCNSWNRCTRDGGGVNCERIIATGEGRERFIVTMDGQVEWIGFLGKEKVVRDFELVVSGTRVLNPMLRSVFETILFQTFVISRP